MYNTCPKTKKSGLISIKNGSNWPMQKRDRLQDQSCVKTKLKIEMASKLRKMVKIKNGHINTNCKKFSSKNSK